MATADRNDLPALDVGGCMTITMYGADWCGDCRRAKAYFAENGVPYTYVDLIERPEATDIVLARNEGKKSIPVIVFADDSHLTEPSNADLEAKLEELSATTARVVEHFDDSGSGRFELWLDGSVLSFATAHQRDGVVTIPHVETAPEHRGHGNAAKLMEGILGLLRATNRSIAPLCPFAADHVRSNERHHDLVAG